MRVCDTRVGACRGQGKCQMSGALELAGTCSGLGTELWFSGRAAPSPALVLFLKREL